MQKGFGSAPKKKFQKDSRYLKFYKNYFDISFFFKKILSKQILKVN